MRCYKAVEIENCLNNNIGPDTCAPRTAGTQETHRSDSRNSKPSAPSPASLPAYSCLSASLPDNSCLSASLPAFRCPSASLPLTAACLPTYLLKAACLPASLLTNACLPACLLLQLPVGQHAFFYSCLSASLPSFIAACMPACLLPAACLPACLLSYVHVWSEMHAAWLPVIDLLGKLPFVPAGLREHPRVL